MTLAHETAMARAAARAVRPTRANARWPRPSTVRPIAQLLAACLVVLAWTAPALAQDATAAAEALFNQGRDLMQQKDFAAACEKFQASHQLDPSVGALLNLGDCREKNDQIASAWGAYREAASLARQNGDARRERFARERSQALEGRLSHLTIEVGTDSRVPGLSLRRDSEVVPEALWNQRVPVDGGTYVIRVEAPGYEPAEVSVEVEAEKDEASAVVPALVELPEAAGGDDSGGPTPGPGPGAGAAPGGRDTGAGGMPLGRKLAIGAGAVGAAGLIAGAIFGLQASSKWDEAKGHCVDGDFDNCDRRGVELGDEAQSRATLSTVGFSVGVVGLAAGAALWFLSSSEAGSAERAARFDPMFGPDRVGASVRLRF